MSVERARILPPYTRRVDDKWHLATKLLLGATLILFSMLMGFAIAVFGLRGWFIPTVPLVALFAIALWMAPDVDTDFEKPIATFFFLAFGFNLMWPNYIAFVIPGLPWIGFERMMMFVVLALSVYALATSSRMRGEVADVMGSNMVMCRLFLAWVLIQFLMVFVGGLDNFARYTNQQIGWNFLFLISAWLMVREGRPERAFQLFAVGVIFTSLLVIPEVMQGKPFWADNIPAFLSVNPEVLEIINSGNLRSGEYRARSIYITSVTYAEFIAVSVGIILFTILHAKSGIRFALGVAALLLLFSVGLLTQSRTAMVGFVVSLPAFAGLWVLRRYRTHAKHRDMLAPAMVWAFPAAVFTFIVSVLVFPRVRVRVLGGSQHTASNEGREAQWDMAIPKIIQNPFGYGVGKTEEVVPYTNLAGKFTIDSYPINVLVEYGVLGFLVHIGLFVAAIVIGSRVYIRAETRDEEVAGAFVVSIFAFLVARMVISSDGAQPIAYLLAGAILALHYRQKTREAALPAPAPAPPIERLGPLPRGAYARTPLPAPPAA